ncbi:MAG: hypothetical protein ACLR0U_30820 [Enterocloster clostridioformis]
MNLAKYDIPYVYLNRSFEDDMEHCLRLDNKKPPTRRFPPHD